MSRDTALRGWVLAREQLCGRSRPVTGCTGSLAVRAQRRGWSRGDWGLLCCSHVRTKSRARRNTKKKVDLANNIFFSSFPGCFLVPLIRLAPLQGLFFGTWWGGGGRNPCSLTCQAGFPKFPRARRSENKFFFFFCPSVYKHLFHPWFLIALAAALKLSVLAEHVSCVEARGGELSDRLRAKKSLLHVGTICLSITVDVTRVLSGFQEVLRTLVASW